MVDAISTSTDRENGRGSVLIVTATDRRRGAEVFTTRLAAGLPTHGWRVRAVSLTTSGDQRTVDVPPLTAVDSDAPGRFNPRIVRALASEIRGFDPTVVLANGGPTLRYAVAGGAFSRAKLVYLAIGEPAYWIRSRSSRVLNRLLLGRVDQVLAVSEMTRAQLLDLQPSLAGRVTVTYTGIPYEMFSTGGERHHGPLRVVMVGSLSDEKDPLLGIRAMAKEESVLGRLVGSGPMRAASEAEIDRLGARGRIELVGSVDDVREHLSWADVLLLCSKTEGLPGAILEAAAAGVATVAVDVGGVIEVVRHGETGLVVDRNSEALAGALATLAADPGLTHDMGRAAREMVASKFAMPVIIKGYADALSGVTG